MYANKYLLSTSKSTPAEAELVSHQLMLRSGMIRMLASGLYSWMPLGLRVARKIENIVREEMNAAGSLELLMPAVQPAELWQESGRWQDYGAELLRFQDRHQRDFCLGPTHEEVITDLVRRDISSYRQLPLSLYQIQTKFRDEIRPRFGVMRGREFVMKDAYSFHCSSDSLAETYEVMRQAYCRSFDRIGLSYRQVAADSGSIGGSTSHEFHVLAASGEDAIAFSDSSAYAANIELAPVVERGQRPEPSAQLEKFPTPDTFTIEALAQNYGIAATQQLKTLIVHAEGHSASTPKLVALIVRGDHRLNAVKAEALPEVAKPLTMATREEVKAAIGANPGSLGAVGLPLPYIVDATAATMADFACGANEEQMHYRGVNWERDCPLERVADIREVVAGDSSPDGEGTLEIKRGIEVGHIFQLGDKYSQAMRLQVSSESGERVTVLMGCYGIGITRIAAAAIEQNNDERGMLWPLSIAPFQLNIIPVNFTSDEQVANLCTKIYGEFSELGVDVLLDDRDLRLGNKLSDSELIGIPFSLVVGSRDLAAGVVELNHRAGNKREKVAIDQLSSVLHNLLLAH